MMLRLQRFQLLERDPKHSDVFLPCSSLTESSVALGGGTTPRGHLINPKRDGNKQAQNHFYRRPRPRGGRAHSRGSPMPLGDPLSVGRFQRARRTGCPARGSSLCIHGTRDGSRRIAGTGRDPLPPPAVPLGRHIWRHSAPGTCTPVEGGGEAAPSHTHKTLGQTKKRLLLT